MTSSKRKYLLFSTFIYTVFILLLLAVELVVRAALPHIPSIEFFVPGNVNTSKESGEKLFEGDPLLGWRLRSDLKNVYWDFTMVEHTNRQHLRMPYDIDDKADDAIRILCLGDSVTFGYRVPVCFPDHLTNYNREALPYPRILERELQKRYPDKKIQVLTLAVPGYTSYQGLNWLKRDIHRYDPDLITICFGWNDTDYRSATDRQALPNDPAKVFIRGLVSKSQAAIYFSRAVVAMTGGGNANAAPGQPVHRVTPENYLLNIMHMVEAAKARGAEAIVFGQVYRDAVENPPQAKVISENRARLKQICDAQKIPYLQFDQLIETNFPANKNLFGELIHPNHIGHQIMADEILRYMHDIKILDRIAS